MKRLAVLACLLGGCGAGAVRPVETGTGTRPGPAGPGRDGVVREYERLANAHRAAVGCGPLRWDGAAGAVAQAHAADMVRRDYFSHTNPEGRSPFDRLRAARVVYTAAAENIAFGYPTAAGVLRGWVASPGHRRNLENCRYTHRGVGLARGKWVEVFMRR